jgi:hypothetical protein
LSGEEDSGGGHVPQIVEGPIILDESPDEDEDEIPLALRPRTPKRKTPEETEDTDLSPSPKRMEVERSEFEAFLEENPRRRGKLGVSISSLGVRARDRQLKPSLSTTLSSTLKPWTNSKRLVWRICQTLVGYGSFRYP